MQITDKIPCFIGQKMPESCTYPIHLLTKTINTQPGNFKMPIDYEEKRDFIRMNTEHVLQFRKISSNEIQQGVCCNLSATGIMFTTEQEISPGTELAVTITPQNSVTSPFDATITVVRTQTNAIPSRYTIAGRITSIR